MWHIYKRHEDNIIVAFIGRRALAMHMQNIFYMQLLRCCEKQYPVFSASNTFSSILRRFGEYPLSITDVFNTPFVCIIHIHDMTFP